MGDQPQTLVRMFFANGRIETRPIVWVRVVTEDEDFAEIINNEEHQIVEEGGEIYIAFANQLISMQVFKGRFTNARLEREQQHHSGSGSERRSYPPRSSRDYRDNNGGRDPDDRR